MKVAYILCTTSPLTGSHLAFKNLLKGVIAQGVKPIVVIPDRQDLYNDLKPLGVPIFITTFRFAIYPYLRSFRDVLLFLPRLVARQVVNWWSVRKLTKYLHEEKVEIIHTNVSVVNIGYKTAQKLNIPHIYHIREYGDLIGMNYFPTKRHFINQLSTPNSYSICITNAIQRHFEQDECPRSRVIYDGVCSQEKEFYIRKKRNYLLYVGRIEPAKRLLDLLEVYCKYVNTHPNPLQLYVIGATTNNNYSQLVSRYVEHNNLSEHIVFWGQRNDVFHFMKHARAIIIPSLSEGFGFCIAEAMFNGCLAIGRDLGGTKEQMDNGLELQGEEIALRYNTPEELLKLLVMVSDESPEHFIPIIERAFDTVNLLYTREHHTEQVLQFYNDILTGVIMAHTESTILTQ